VTPYFEHGGVTIYHGDCREVVPQLGMFFDVVIADPPYEKTSLQWDRWPVGWLKTMVASASGRASMWCFGSFAMFQERRDEFAAAPWRYTQDVVWEKHSGSSFHADRFKRVHELAVQYIPAGQRWDEIYKKPVTTPDATPRQVRRKQRPKHTGSIGESVFVSEDGGPRLMRSVVYARSCHGYAENETQKPESIVRPLAEYSCPPGGLVLSPFAGSGTDLVVAKQLGLRAIGIDVREDQCEIAARRVSQELSLVR
jgi:site-specific DNA-methyltransferase (adenine-specific)